MADVFISYSRIDSVFVHALDDYLKSEERDVWVDWEDIPPASDWQQDIYDNIDSAESFVFVVSTKSLVSEYCGKEFERAQKGGKRIVPIACDAANPAEAHPALGQLNWIWCRESDDRDAAYAKLTNALDTDLAWAKAHTRLLVHAVDWEARGEDGSLLLRGRDLTDAEQQLAANAAKQPMPTELQQRYVHASRRGAARRQRFLLGGVSLALAVSIALGVVALLQRNTADHRARVARSQTFAAEATQAVSAAPVTALADAVKAVETSATPEAETVLRQAILANPIEYMIPGTRQDVASARAGRAGGSGPGEVLEFSGDGRQLLGLTPDGRLHLWQSATGRPATRLLPARAAAAHLGPGGAVLSSRARAVRLDARAVHLPAGTHAAGLGFAGGTPLALVAGRGKAAVLNVATGKSVQLRAPHVTAAEAVFSAAGGRVLTQDAGGGEIDVWDVHSGRLLAKLPGGVDPALSADGRFVATACCVGGALWSVAPRRRLADLGSDAQRVVFSPNSRQLLVVEYDGSASLYRSSNGTVVAKLPDFGTLNPYRPGSGITVYSPAYDAAAAFGDHGHVALANSDGVVRVWELGTIKVVAAVAAGFANALAFGRGGQLAAMTWNGDVVVSRLAAGVALADGLPDGQAAFAPALSQDRTRFVMPSPGGAVFARLDGSHAQRFPAPSNTRGANLGSWAISGDGTVVAASAQPQCCVTFPSFRSWTSVWRVGSRSPGRRFPVTDGAIMLGATGSVIAFGGRAWRTSSGARIHGLDGIRSLSPDGGVALVRRAGTVSIVRVTAPSGPSTPLHGFGVLGPNGKLSAAFSPDHSRLLTVRGNDVRLWDVSTGQPLAQLGRPGEGVRGFSFSADGRLALITFDDRAATFSSASGAKVLSQRGSFGAVSPDGKFAASVGSDGVVQITDLSTGIGSSIQTDTALPLSNLSFGPTAATLIVTDRNGAVHTANCVVCATGEVLYAQARSALARLPRTRRAPPLAATG